MTWLCPASSPLPWVTIEVKTGPETTTVAIDGELDLATMPLLARQLAQVARENPGRVVFDLTGTGFMDCGSARLIARIGSSLPEGRRPVIRNPGPGVRRVLELTGLAACCEIES